MLKVDRKSLIAHNRWVCLFCNISDFYYLTVKSKNFFICKDVGSQTTPTPNQKVQGTASGFSHDEKRAWPPFTFIVSFSNKVNKCHLSHLKYGEHELEELVMFAASGYLAWARGAICPDEPSGERDDQSPVKLSLLPEVSHLAVTLHYDPWPVRQVYWEDVQAGPRWRWLLPWRCMSSQAMRDAPSCLSWSLSLTWTNHPPLLVIICHYCGRELAWTHQ